MANRIFTIIILLASLLPMQVAAQDIDEQMDAIKLDENMVFGEGMADDQGRAAKMALDELAGECNNLRIEAGKPGLSPDVYGQYASKLETQKNGRFTILLYISLEKALALTSASAPARQPRPQPQPEPQQQVQPRQQPKPIPQLAPASQGNMVDEIAMQNTWTELRPMLARYKQQGKIHDSGSTSSAADVPQDAYVLMFDADGDFVAFLAPRQSAPRLNYKTRQPDTESNHPTAKFILWYR